MDINCDLGEYDDRYDDQLMPLVTSCNIACGMHAGSPALMRKTILLALKHHVQIGAHPGYPDRGGFGRREMNLSPEEIFSIVLYQVGAARTMVEVLGGKLVHVKPHGALYNKAAKDEQTATAMIHAIGSVDKSLILLGLGNSEHERTARKFGIPFAAEAFADRRYTDDALLVSRADPLAIIEDADESIDQVLSMVLLGKVVSVNRKEIRLAPDSICIHGDHKDSLVFARKLTEAFRANHVDLQPFGRADGI